VDCSWPVLLISGYKVSIEPALIPVYRSRPGFVLPTWAKLLILEASCYWRESPILEHRVLSEHAPPRTRNNPLQVGSRRAVPARMARPFAHGTFGRASLANRGRSPSRPAIACVHDALPAPSGFRTPGRSRTIAPGRRLESTPILGPTRLGVPSREGRRLVSASVQPGLSMFADTSGC